MNLKHEYYWEKCWTNITEESILLYLSNKKFTFEELQITDIKWKII